MKINKKDCKIETMRGTGPGGQHRNKTDSAVRITHLPTGISAYCDERSQHQSMKKAWKDLEKKLRNIEDEKRAKEKKTRRDHAIHNTEIIRTYDYSRGIVKDHRSKKQASLKDIMEKGRIDLLREDFPENLSENFS